LRPIFEEAERGVGMTELQRHGSTAMQAVSNAMVKLHKEQFGRGPTNARSDLAGPDTLVCVLEGARLPAERQMVEMGDQQRVREARLYFQVATSAAFIAAVEDIVERRVKAFASASDPDQNIVFEIFHFEPSDHGRNQHDSAERSPVDDG
jgi:uncharacterized protein YbcI